MKEEEAHSLWKVTVGPRFDSRRVDADIDCDVVVIGGGFTGLRAALCLAEQGVRVSVFEAGDVGWGASGRNGGQVNPMLPVARPEDLRKAVGDVYFERMAKVSLDSADALFDLVRKHRIDCDARQHGWLRADHGPSARGRARAAAQEWNRFGAGFEFLDGDDARKAIGSDVYQSATLGPRGGAVQPLSLAKGLAVAAAEAGAAIYGEARATDMKRVDQRWVLNVNGHTVRAPQVVLATNGYTDDLFKGLKRGVMPLTPTQMATDPLPPEEIEDILPGGQTISDTRRMIMYARREPGNQMVFGGMGFRKPAGGFGGFGWLLQDALRIFPTIPAHRWQYRWGGHIALTDDRVPHFHEPAPGVMAGMGYNGRGVAMSLVMGRVLADRALGTAPEELPFPVLPVRKVPFRDIQIAGSGIAMSWMRLRDRLESG